MKARWTLLAVAPLALAACEDEATIGDEPIETGGEAAGEVLGGTISDDMIPLDQLTSTSPPAEEAADEAEESED